MYQGGRGHKTVNFGGTQSFITTLSYSLALKRWVLKLRFDLVGSKIKMSKQFNQ